MTSLSSNLHQRLVYRFTSEVPHQPKYNFEVRHAPNTSVAGDRDPRDRGSRPLNTDR